MPETVLKRTTGDTLPSYDGELSGQDITGYSIRMNVQRPDGTNFNKIASLVEPTNGKFQITFLSTDFSVAGDYPSEIEVTDVSGDNETFSNITIKVKAAIA